MERNLSNNFKYLGSIEIHFGLLLVYNIIINNYLYQTFYSRFFMEVFFP